MSSSNCCIFYFSGMGNTWWASQRMAEALKARGIFATAYSIEQTSAEITAELANKADLIGLGFPIYGSDAPENFHAFLKTLPTQASAKPTFGFVTQWAWSGNGMNFLEKELQGKGYALRWSAEFNMFNNIALTAVPTFYSADARSSKKKLEKAGQQIGELCDKIAKNEGYRQHNHWWNKAAGWTQRILFQMVRERGRTFWSVDEAACTSCGRCARICPVENIEMREGLPVFGEACVFCMRCFNYCPTFAIHYMGASNKRLTKKPPFQGPTAEFRPELIIKQKSGT